MSEDNTQIAKPGWAKWYREAREEAAFRYGLRSIPVDTYKTEFFQGLTVIEAVATIAKNNGLQAGRP